MVYNAEEEQIFCQEIPAVSAVMGSFECAGTEEQTDAWLSEGCPRAGAIGYCAITEGQPTTIYYYPAHHSDAQSMKSGCESLGATWHDL